MVVEDFLEVKCFIDTEDSEGVKGLMFAEGPERATSLVMHLCDVLDALGVEDQAHGPCKCGLFTHIGSRTSLDNQG